MPPVGTCQCAEALRREARKEGRKRERERERERETGWLGVNDVGNLWKCAQLKDVRNFFFSLTCRARKCLVDPFCVATIRGMCRIEGRERDGGFAGN